MLLRPRQRTDRVALRFKHSDSGVSIHTISTGTPARRAVAMCSAYVHVRACVRAVRASNKRTYIRAWVGARLEALNERVAENHDDV